MRRSSFVIVLVSAMLLIVLAISLRIDRQPSSKSLAGDASYNRGPMAAGPAPAPTPAPTHSGPTYSLEFASPSGKGAIVLQGSDRIGPVEYRDYRVQYRLGSAPIVSLDQATWFDPSSSEIYRNPVKWLSDEVALIPLMSSPSEYLKLNTLNLGTGAITDLQVRPTRGTPWTGYPGGSMMNCTSTLLRAPSRR